MRVTPRDRMLVRDVALSHVLSRDQILALGYFTSVTRANTRLRILCSVGLLRRLETPFFTQGLYVAGKEAGVEVGERIAPLLTHRRPSPRFLQHALMVINVRVALLRRSGQSWRFEIQARRQFSHAGKTVQVRPDGLIEGGERSLTFVEVDLGHVAPAKFRLKLAGYAALATSGQCGSLYGQGSFRLLIVTTGTLRAARLMRLLPSDPPFNVRSATFAELKIPALAGWS